MSSSTFRTVPRGPGPEPLPADRRSIAEELSRASDSLGRLIRDHIGLARLELKGEARKITTEAMIGLSALPFVLAGIVMMDVALSIGISSWVGGAWAFLIVGAFNLLIAGSLGLYAATKLRQHRRLDALSEELERNTAVAQQVRDRMRRRPPADGVATNTQSL